MKTMTLNEFKKFIKTLEYKEIILSSENQDTERYIDSSSHFCFTFNDITITCEPTARNVTLSGAYNNKFFILRIKQIKYEESLIGHVITFICEKFVAEKETEYQLIFR